MSVIVTIAACSTAIGAIMCIAVLLAWFKDGRPRHRRWLFAPFGLAVPAGLMLTFPGMLPGPWGLLLGWFLLTIVYGSIWLASRVMVGREPLPMTMLLPCLIVFGFCCLSTATDSMQDFRMMPRIALFALFNGLAARELKRCQAPRLQAATTLMWIFTAFCLIDVARLPFSLSLPAPLGPREPEIWTIALFNFLVVLEGSLLGVFVTALGREELAARHYRLAVIDPLTGIGNRRALDQRILQLILAPCTDQVRAVAVIDIDHFKSINDELGHSFGDVVIAGTASVACEAFGPDNVFRVGGEEFAAIVEGARPDHILRKVEALRSAISARSHFSGHQSRRCTASIGLAMLDESDDFSAAFKSADKALYTAKRMGRNQVVLAEGAIVTLQQAPPLKTAAGGRR